jgi:hypothetical protein
LEAFEELSAQIMRLLQAQINASELDRPLTVKEVHDSSRPAICEYLRLRILTHVLLSSRLATIPSSPSPQRWFSSDAGSLWRCWCDVAGVRCRCFRSQCIGRAATGSARSHRNSVGRRPLRSADMKAVGRRMSTRHLWQLRVQNSHCVRHDNYQC